MTGQQIEFPLSVAVCAWCEPVEPGASVGELSHGICLRHLKKLKLQLIPRGTQRPRPGASPQRRRKAAGEVWLPL
jgi:hypothetical protein